MVNEGIASDRQRRKDEIEKRLLDIRHHLPTHVQLIVVTKNFPASDVEILYELGERNFGENRVQELVAKRALLSEEINRECTWHYQGQIQGNKVPALNRSADVIHSVDTERIAERLDPSKKVFLQVNLDPQGVDALAEESQLRAGIDPSNVTSFAKRLYERFGSNFLGVMGIAPHFPGITKEDVVLAFSKLRGLSESITEFAPSAHFISAGMSDDYREALAAGATHIRLGSSILGSRSGNA